MVVFEKETIKLHLSRLIMIECIRMCRHAMIGWHNNYLLLKSEGNLGYPIAMIMIKEYKNVPHVVLC